MKVAETITIVVVLGLVIYEVLRQLFPSAAQDALSPAVATAFGQDLANDVVNDAENYNGIVQAGLPAGQTIASADPLQVAPDPFLY